MLPGPGAEDESSAAAGDGPLEATATTLPTARPAPASTEEEAG
jgi:hypothetical protein